MSWKIDDNRKVEVTFNSVAYIYILDTGCIYIYILHYVIYHIYYVYNIYVYVYILCYIHIMYAIVGINCAIQNFAFKDFRNALP